VADYFRPDYTGGAFELFGVSHAATILFFAAIGLFLIKAGQTREANWRRATRYGLAAVLLVNELSWHVWNAVYGSWAIQTMLPLHMCSIMVWVTIYVLATERQSLYPLLYFFGVAGAMQALITPDAGIYGFPHFRFFQTMIAHGALVVAGVWVVMVEKYRPTCRDLVRLLAGLNVYAVIVYGINVAIGSNYLYVVGKPDVPSLMDFFPAWPWYIFLLEILAVVIFWLLYLPFARVAPEARQ